MVSFVYHLVTLWWILVARKLVTSCKYWVISRGWRQLYMSLAAALPTFSESHPTLRNKIVILYMKLLLPDIE